MGRLQQSPVRRTRSGAGLSIALHPPPRDLQRFCDRSHWARRSSSTRFDVCAASLDSLGQQFGQAEQVIGGHHECELPIDVQVRRATKL
jgi:hypothetical protein